MEGCFKDVFPDIRFEGAFCDPEDGIVVWFKGFRCDEDGGACFTDAGAVAEEHAFFF